MSFDGKETDAEDIVDTCLSGGFYCGPLVTLNFMTVDWIAIFAMLDTKRH